MRFLPLFTTLVFSALSTAQQNENPISFPSGSTGVSANSNLQITWQPTTQGGVTLTLRNGKPSDLSPGLIVATLDNNPGSFSWPVPGDIVNGQWTVEIKDSAEPPHYNYSPLFAVSGGTGVSSKLTTPTPTRSTTTATATTTETRKSSEAKTSSGMATTTVTPGATNATTAPGTATTGAAAGRLGAGIMGVVGLAGMVVLA